MNGTQDISKESIIIMRNSDAFWQNHKISVNEPLIGYEYVRDCAALIHERGSVNVLVINGTIEEAPWRGLLYSQGFTTTWYRRPAGVDPNIPLHLSRFFPQYRMTDRPPTPVEKVYRLADEARTYLVYVYMGNC